MERPGRTMPLQPEPIEPPAPDTRPRLALVPRPGDGLGADALPLPGELALLLRVPLPLASHRQRQAAVAFAVEDLIAEPLEAVHVALGPELAPGEYLAAVVRHAEMALWAGQARSGQRLVPEVLAIPVPPEGSWSVHEIAGRARVRRADGTGFATRLETFEAFWHAGGAPQIVLYGGRLPEAVPAGATGLLPAAATDVAARFDLLQGPYARADAGWRRAGPRLAAVVALALAAHAAILGADTYALRGIADEREAALRRELAARLGDLPATVPLDVALGRALPQAEAAGGGLLPLLARVGEVLEPLAGEIAFRDLSYGAAEGSLAVMLEAPDLATLQRIESDLAAAGLAVSAGVATTGEGAAEARYVIGGPGR